MCRGHAAVRRPRPPCRTCSGSRSDKCRSRPHRDRVSPAAAKRRRRCHGRARGVRRTARHDLGLARSGCAPTAATIGMVGSRRPTASSTRSAAQAHVADVVEHAGRRRADVAVDVAAAADPRRPAPAPAPRAAARATLAPRLRPWRLTPRPPDREVGGNIKSAGHSGNVPQRPPTRGGNRGSVPCGVIPGRGLVVLLALATVGLASCSGDDGHASPCAPRASTASSTTTSAAASSTTTTKPDPCASPPVTVSGPPARASSSTTRTSSTVARMGARRAALLRRAVGTIKIVAGRHRHDVRDRADRHHRARRRLQRTRPPRARAQPQLRDRPLRLRVLLRSRLHDAGGAAVPRLRRRRERARDDRHPAVGQRLLPQGRPARVRARRQALRDPGRRALGAPRLGGTASRSVPQDPNDVRGKILRYNPDGTIPSRQPVRPRPSRRGPPASATRSASRSTPPGTSSSRRTGRRATSALRARVRPRVRGRPRRPLPVAGVLRLQPPRPRGDVVPGSARARAGAARTPRSCRPARRGSTPRSRAVRGPLRLLQPYSGDAGLHARLTARDGQSGPDECLFDVKQGPDHALYFSDQSAIYRLGPDTTHP